MLNDKIVRLEDVLAALGEEPEVWEDDAPEQIQEHWDWERMNDAISAVLPLPFGVHELTEVEICTLHGDNVIVSAPTIPDLDKRVVLCLGSHKDPDGHKYIVLDGEEYSQSLFIDGTLKLYKVV